MNLLVRNKNQIKVTNDTLEDTIISLITTFGNNVDLNHIDVSEVTSMEKLFSSSNFNGDISLWNTKNVKTMKGCFFGSRFNGDISQWNTKAVKNMSYMFRSSNFNGDISEWNVEKVTDMIDMFWKSDFKGDLNKWRPHNVVMINDMFHGCWIENNPPLWFLYKSDFHHLFDNLNEFLKSIERFDWLRPVKIIKRGRFEVCMLCVSDYDEKVLDKLVKNKKYKVED